MAPPRSGWRGAVSGNSSLKLDCILTERFNVNMALERDCEMITGFGITTLGSIARHVNAPRMLGMLQDQVSLCSLM